MPATTGDTRGAIATFARVESVAPRTPAAAEAQRARFATAEPLAWMEVDSLLRAARDPIATHSLEALSSRARPLAADIRLPWQQPCLPGRLTPARARRGFRTIRQTLPDLAGAG